MGRVTSDMDKPKVFAVIPALNEENTIAQVLRGVKNYVDEIILVDDGSTDKTAEIAREMDVIVILNERNLGYEPSINRGFSLAAEKNATVILTFDGDGQHDPVDIPKIVDPILKGEADVVVGMRPHYPRVMEYLFAIIAKRKANIRDPLCGLKAYHVKVYKDIGFFDRISSIGVQFVFSAKKKGYRIEQRPISIQKRKDDSRFGKSIKANWKILKAIVKTI